MSMNGSMLAICGATGAEAGIRERDDLFVPIKRCRRRSAAYYSYGGLRNDGPDASGEALARRGDAMPASATACPRRQKPSAVISTFALESLKRTAAASAPEPEKIGTKIAPICAIASAAIAVSGIIGRKIPTRSPRPTPSLRGGARGARYLTCEFGESQRHDCAILTFPNYCGLRRTLAAGMPMNRVVRQVEFAAHEPRRPLDPGTGIDHLGVWGEPFDAHKLECRAPERIASPRCSAGRAPRSPAAGARR